MSGTFKDCSSLQSLDLSSWNTPKVTNMSEMFYNCSKLTSLDLSNFDTSKVTDMSGTFSGCSNLTSLDLSNFDTSNVEYMGRWYVSPYGMFYNCNKLKNIYVSDKWSTDNVTDYSHQCFKTDTAFIILLLVQK